MVTWFLPQVAHAQPESIEELVLAVNKTIINPLIQLLFAVALVYFIWGLVAFIINKANNPEKAQTGRSHMLWGIIGMAIMAGVFGIMQLLTTLLG